MPRFLLPIKLKQAPLLTQLALKLAVSQVQEIPVPFPWETIRNAEGKPVSFRNLSNKDLSNVRFTLWSEHDFLAKSYPCRVCARETVKLDLSKPKKIMTDSFEEMRLTLSWRDPIGGDLLCDIPLC